MKKVLYGTTALVAAGVLSAGTASADGISMSVGGYFHTFFSVGDIDNGSADNADYNSTGLFSDGEIYFNGEYKHDNGITFGVTVQLEAQSQGAGDQIDENWIYVKGDFGLIEAGSRNSAAYRMHYAAPNVGIPINSGWVTVFIPQGSGITGVFRGPTGSTYLDYGNDENSISYYTPRFSGFQLGLTYTPSVVGGGEGKNYPVEANKETEYHNGFGVGVNFVEDFNGFGVALSAGYRRASASDAADAAGYDDYQAISFGANLSYAGFTVGGSYANELDGAPSHAMAGSTEGESFDVGVSYATGPWSVGLTWFEGKSEGAFADPGEQGLSAIQGGVAYQVGPGIRARGGVMWAEWNPENGTTQSGVIGAVGLSFSF